MTYDLNTMAEPGARVVIDYTNHKGERREREIVPEEIEFRSTPYHPERQWVLQAWDVEKKARRTFPLRFIHSWRPAQPVKEAHDA